MIRPIAVFADVDRWLLLKVNRAWTHPVLDAAMPLLTDLHHRPWFSFGVVPAALAVWLWKGRKRALKALVVAGLAVGSADLVMHRVIKPWAGRPRPARTVSAVIVRAPAGGAWSFPSNHAANVAAAGAVLTVAYPAWAPAFAGAALLVAYSRVYVGAHYPGDVLGGLALGAALGFVWAGVLLAGEGGGAPKKKKK